MEEREREREATSRIRREDLGDISKKKKFLKTGERNTAKMSTFMTSAYYGSLNSSHYHTDSFQTCLWVPHVTHDIIISNSAIRQ